VAIGEPKGQALAVRHVVYIVSNVPKEMDVRVGTGVAHKDPGIDVPVVGVRVRAVITPCAGARRARHGNE
jgi:hypothetical protein